MLNNLNTSAEHQKIWENFSKENKLEQKQVESFKKYLQLLHEANEIINLTNITDVLDIINYHFQDSLIISNFIDFNKIQSICDIGTGGGFPAIPLKIKYPQLNVILIEVSAKKREFLEHLINELSLKNIEIYPFDWRTFLRKSSYQVDLFLSRASLHTDELIRVFKPSTAYNSSNLVYWASINWQPTNKELPYIKKNETYEVGTKKRKLIFFTTKR